MPNLTVSVNDEELIRKAKAAAAMRGKSVSQIVREFLEDFVEREETLETAGRRARSRMEMGYSMGGQPLTREEVHDRTLEAER